ncbi:MAG: DUF262 domain-containing protein [Fibromonadaceae bacterium]|jgi:hypothetical protein|nr:DUF262 domain-containing protein [Fibromonadaceae bacterium]
MNNNINTQSGERLSFYKLFCENQEKQYRVSIPIIQRDYAQGRQTTTEVRNIFLDALYNYLEENKPNRDLDFVYGSLDKTGKFTDFIPLDGQQRLTTLFLLHWYLYQISENTEKKAEFKKFLQKDGKSMFTYETRSSSSEFCDALMSNDIGFSSLLENSLSKTIENSSWFFLSWKYDPTIKSMLTMLDAIHSKFANKKEYFERLIDTENPIITFLFLNLKDFNLTDDLYIKMNSRGKQLTSFENFKAKFEQRLENENPKRKFLLVYDGKEKEVSLKKYFSYKIDTIWANLFWAYRELVGDKDVYDEELKFFIRVILANQYAISNEADENFEFLLGTQVAKKRKDYTDDISYFKYEELKAITEQSILYLIDAFDNLINENNKIKIHLSESYKFYFDENKIFENALKHSFFVYQERVLFHAYIRFLIENNDRTGIEQWMRVIHNLANNTPIDGAAEISNAMKSIEKLMPYSNNILKYLCQNPKIDFFSGWQTSEEKIKAHLISKNDNWKNKIENAEKNGCFDGQIGFILEFSGIVDYYERNGNCNWTEQDDKNYFNSFEKYANKAIAIFKNKDSYNNKYIWERAVLTKGDYLITISDRKNLLTSDRKARDYSWKRLLRIADEHNKPKRQFVKQVFDDNVFDENNVQNSLEKICKNKTDTWRDYLITCPDLIKCCGQGFIRYKNENDIILLKESQMNHWHSEMYSMFLWKQYIEPQKEKFKPFKDIGYYYVKNSEEYGHIVLGDFCHDRIYYEINIYYNDKSYKIAFKKSKGGNGSDKYGEDIKNILANLSFNWNEGDGAYSFASNDCNTLMKKLEALNAEIEKI